jgi:hypothetical protein
MYLTKNKTERCVMARVQRQGKRYQANFTLHEYGDWKAALAAGQNWVDSIIKNLPPPASRKGTLTPRNKSGVVGVYLHRQTLTKKVGRKNKVYKFQSWIARWPGCINSGGVKWPVKQFGKDDAFVLAVLCRQMETVDRDAIVETLNGIKDMPEYAKILALRKA